MLIVQGLSSSGEYKAYDKNLCTNLIPNILVSVCCYFYLKHLSLGSVTCKWVEGPPSGNEDGSASTVVCPGRFLFDL